jgi:hypothetical protein
MWNEPARMTLRRTLMENYTYEEALKYVIRLSDEDKLELFKFLANVLLPKIKITTPQRNVMEFEGVGGDAWKGIDVKQFIEEERNSWDRE